MNMSTSFGQANAAIEKATASREMAIKTAFSILHQRKPLMAQALLDSLRDARRAARWMCLNQRAFGGRNAYQILAEGDDDLVWDEMGRSIVGDSGLMVAR